MTDTDKNKVRSFAGKWIELRISALDEIRQAREQEVPVFCHMRNGELRGRDVMKVADYEGGGRGLKGG